MKSEHGDTLMVFIIIAASVIILVVFPLLIIADNATDTVGSTLQVQIDEAATEVAYKKVLTMDDYSRIIASISNPNMYEVTFKIDKIDENVGKKTVQVNSKVQGENVYITLYHSQIMEILRTVGQVELNTGDAITIQAVSVNQSTAAQLTGQNPNIAEHSASSTQTVP